MRAHTFSILAAVLMLATLCASCATVPTKQPIPGRPLIGGEISGISNKVLVTIHIRTFSGREVRQGTRQGSGSWEVVVTQADGVDYTVTAEAEGYVSQPVSYTTHISGDTAYVVRNGQVTDEEAVHLDFHFVPKDSP